MISIYYRMKEIIALADKTPGILIDLGFGKGNSLKSIISWMNSDEIVKRDIQIYESFNGYPAPTSEDEGAFKKGGFKRPPQPAYDIVHTIKKKVSLHKGFVESTLNSYNKAPIGVIHCHLGPYSSTLFSLETLYEYLKVGGVIIIDGYNDFPGTKLAVDKFVTDKKLMKFFGIQDNFSYIRKAPIKKLGIEKITRTRSVLT